MTDVSTQKQLRKIILPKEVDYKQFLIDIYIELDSIIKELKTEIEIWSKFTLIESVIIYHQWYNLIFINFKITLLSILNRNLWFRLTLLIKY